MRALAHVARRLSGLFIGLAFLIAGLFVFQDRLLYLPSKVSREAFVPPGMQAWSAQAPLVGTSVSDAALAEHAGADDPVLGILAPPLPGTPATGTAIVFHGNAGHAGHRVFYARALAPLGVRTILAEYPGYGPRAGRPSEAAIVEDAAGFVRLAHERHGEPIWLVGESLGAGVAAAVAAREPYRVQGIVLITPWNRLAEVAAIHYPFLPVRWLLRSDYDSVKALERFDGPKLVIVATRDDIVPAALGEDLYQRLSQPKRLVRIEGAGHNDWPGRAPPSLWEDAVRWLREHAGP